MLTTEFVDQQLSDIARENGIGPHKLARARKRGKAGQASWHHELFSHCYLQVPVNFSFVDVSGTTGSIDPNHPAPLAHVCEVDKRENYEFLLIFLSSFVNSPTAKECQVVHACVSSATL